MRAIAVVVVELGDARLDLLPLSFQGADALGDDDWIDASLDRGELPLDPALHVGELVADSLALGAAVALQFGGESGGLPAEVL